MLVKGGQKMGEQPLTSKALNRQFCNYGKNSEGLIFKICSPGCQVCWTGLSLAFWRCWIWVNSLLVSNALFADDNLAESSFKTQKSVSVTSPCEPGVGQANSYHLWTMILLRFAYDHLWLADRLLSAVNNVLIKVYNTDLSSLKPYFNFDWWKLQRRC